MARGAVIEAELALDARAELGEGPVWHDGRLHWVDMPAGTWHRGPAGAVRLGARVSCVRPRRAGGWVAAVDGGLVLLGADGREERRVTLGPGVLNDGCCDPAGRFLVGSVAPGRLLQVDGGGAVAVLREGVEMSNGVAFSPDGRVLFHVDSGTRTVAVLDYDAERGIAGPPRPLLTLSDGIPDGLAVDAEGGLWLAVWGAGEVRRYTADGVLAARVRVPASQVTSCAFGGAGLDVLWITTARDGRGDAEPLAGGLFACRPGVAGCPVALFAG